MDKLEEMKKKLYTIAKEECPSVLDDMNEIFRREIEIPISKVYDIEQDENWYDINDYMED